MESRVDEIAAQIFRICTYVPEMGLQFNQFLVRDEEPLLYHTGMRSLFPQVLEMVRRVVDPVRLRWIGCSHFEPDECGALNDWLDVAPGAQAFGTTVCAAINLGLYAARPPRTLADDEVLTTGNCRFRLLATPHLPHGWDAGMLFESSRKVLFCSDLFLQPGDPVPLTDADVLGPHREALVQGQQGPLADSVPYHTRTAEHLETLARLGPTTLAIMHGSSYTGDAGRALRDLAPVLREVSGVDSTAAEPVLSDDSTTVPEPRHCFLPVR